MHTSADKIIEMFNGANSSDDTSSQTDTNIVSNPAKLSYVVKQCLREAAVGKCFVYTESRSMLQDLIHVMLDFFSHLSPYS